MLGAHSMRWKARVAAFAGPAARLTASAPPTDLSPAQDLTGQPGFFTLPHQRRHHICKVISVYTNDR